ncbi:hypothetical protein FB461_1974 [Rarobacter faecitabidus]|uniref:Uncharacterized protein n=1 Tax=Rarobacter faecitabidus TaxID=13243 RepID=A0A542ZE46_RARFA|nr:hypothetical protein FB461_1974 [Rarobacter faecitabidus]
MLQKKQRDDLLGRERASIGSEVGVEPGGMLFGV